ncbi:hypothetical protein FPRO06_11990 [Fusarium proliferatum]|nr:hypothetical protein FPRO06_11990 [Fusarium proliferatum]CVL13570.1 uncharacterized protein FPRN_06959 [Fusarium proliferatum]
MSLTKFCRGNVGRLLSADCLEAEASARMYFVSFLGSRIHDPQEFWKTFQATMEPSPCKIFGGKEKRTDAISHYHVLIVLEKALTLTDGIGGLRMWYNFDFQNEVDTYDIEIRVKQDEQYISSFRKHVEWYMLRVVDPGTCFGDQSLSPFPPGVVIGREAEIGLGLFQIGDDAPTMTTPTYLGRKSIPAFLCLNDCPPPCASPCAKRGIKFMLSRPPSFKPRSSASHSAMPRIVPTTGLTRTLASTACWDPGQDGFWVVRAH